MILTCPNCETQYFAGEDSLGDGVQEVKCTACGHEWRVQQTAEPVAEPRPPGHEIWRQRQRKRLEKAKRTAVVLAWTTGFALFIGAVVGAGIFRNEVVRYWPQSATAFEAVGLDVNRFGLEITDVDSRREFDGTTPVLTVTGKAVNVTRVTQPAAAIRIGLRDDRGEEVSVVFTQPEAAEIGAGAQTGFRVVLTDPPPEAYTLDVSLVEADRVTETARADTSADTPRPPASEDAGP
jgi:predicted Zn finger-like uncharacterized protein